MVESTKHNYLKERLTGIDEQIEQLYVERNKVKQLISVEERPKPVTKEMIDEVMESSQKKYGMTAMSMSTMTDKGAKFTTGGPSRVGLTAGRDSDEDCLVWMPEKDKYSVHAGTPQQDAIPTPEEVVKKQEVKLHAPSFQQFKYDKTPETKAQQSQSLMSPEDIELQRARAYEQSKRRQEQEFYDSAPKPEPLPRPVQPQPQQNYDPRYGDPNDPNNRFYNTPAQQQPQPTQPQQQYQPQFNPGPGYPPQPHQPKQNKNIIIIGIILGIILVLVVLFPEFFKSLLPA